jgi:membrane-associated phospholipid phosphatase
MKRLTSFVCSLALIFSVLSSLYSQSPYTVTWDKEPYILGTGMAGSAVGFFLDRSVPALTAAEINQLSSESINWFDRSATDHFSESAGTVSDVLFGIAVAAPMILLTDQSIRNDWRTVAVMYLETWSFVGTTTMIAKGSAMRIRPFVYNPSAPMDQKLAGDARKSFFSGHTTTAFASAVFLSTVYSDYNPGSHWKPYIWAGSLLTASVVGYLRYEAGAHFPTDILVGALVGSAIGYTIPWMHRAGNKDVTFTPGTLRTDFGISMQLKF